MTTTIENIVKDIDGCLSVVDKVRRGKAVTNIDQFPRETYSKVKAFVLQAQGSYLYPHMKALNFKHWNAETPMQRRRTKKLLMMPHRSRPL